ncbi:hypothetical protein C8F04DRAFT_1174156 [Mycena alexandri]|uniref:Uncharacterized protein n=1 Tax=Mycena alexandri TaxID=1745969 RepID=A0AAD6TEP9_9AGAR|nr:hypothetical protein C8F04DRAFT_1174156 [Mycena alexandri]
MFLEAGNSRWRMTLLTQWLIHMRTSVEFFHRLGDTQERARHHRLKAESEPGILNEASPYGGLADTEQDMYAAGVGGLSICKATRDLLISSATEWHMPKGSSDLPGECSLDRGETRRPMNCNTTPGACVTGASECIHSAAGLWLSYEYESTNIETGGKAGNIVIAINKKVRISAVAGRDASLVEASPPFRIRNEDGTESVIAVKLTLKWLGVLFDRKLTFDPHARAADRACSKVNGSRMLADTVKGLSQEHLRTLYRTRVLSVHVRAPHFVDRQGKTRRHDAKGAEPGAATHICRFPHNRYMHSNSKLVPPVELTLDLIWKRYAIARLHPAWTQESRDPGPPEQLVRRQGGGGTAPAPIVQTSQQEPENPAKDDEAAAAGQFDVPPRIGREDDSIPGRALAESSARLRGKGTHKRERSADGKEMHKEKTTSSCTSTARCWRTRNKEDGVWRTASPGATKE